MEAARLQTMDQKRSEHAWECVKDGISKEYANLAKSMPAMVMASGLMPTLAFLKGKGETQHEHLLGDVLEWLMKVELLSPGRGFRDAMEQLKAMSAREYQRATEEALAILKWIRYFADAMKGGGNA